LITDCREAFCILRCGLPGAGGFLRKVREVLDAANQP
jgi:hypothetical protein